MGFFDILFGKKSTTSSTTSVNTTPSEPVKDLNPKEKDLKWFQSEYGIESLKEHTTPKAYLLEERLEKEYENKDFNGRNDVTFDVFIAVYHKDVKIPSIYFSNFVNAIEDEYNIGPLKYVGPSEMLTKVLTVLAKTYELDDDGEPVKKKSALTVEDLVSFENNPVLKFVKEFDVFDLKDDDTGSWSDKFNIYSDILIFLGLCSFEDKNVLEENKWLLEEEPYYNSLGIIKKKKGFFKYCIEHCTYPDYWKDKLDELENE